MNDDELHHKALIELRDRGPRPGSAWRHRKGALYTVRHLCVIEATLTPAVAYGSVVAAPSSPLWVRPLDEFLDGRFTLECDAL